MANKNIPALEKLKSIPHWIFYKNEIKPGDEKPTKLPKNPHTGKNASSTNKRTWGTFYQAIMAKKRYPWDGLSFALTEDLGIVGIDLDDCIDENGKLSKRSQSIISSLNSYTEISPSGKGLHIFVYGKIPKALGPIPNNEVEMYSEARFLTMTGNMWPGSNNQIRECQGEIDKLWKEENDRRNERKKIVSQITTSKPTIKPPDNDKLKSYTEKSYLDEIALLSMATEGNRNDTLNRCAFNLGQFIQANLLDRTEVESTLFSLACQLGLGEIEAYKTIQSGLKGGINNPRTNWPTLEDTPQETKPNKITPPLPKNDLVYHEAVIPYLDYIKDRWGLTKQTVETFRVGYCNECPTSNYSASFTVPYYDSSQLVDIRHHLLTPNGQGDFRPEVEGYPEHLFDAAFFEVSWEKSIILVEREFSAMILCQNGLPSVGLPNTFKTQWIDTFTNKGVKKAYIALTPDKRKQAWYIASKLAKSGIDARVTSIPFSPHDMLIKYGCSLADFCKFLEQSWGIA